MNLTSKKCEEINEEYLAIRRTRGWSADNGVGTHKLNIHDSIDCSIFAGNWQICRLENLNSIIEELTDMKQAIENVTGIR